MLRIITKDMHTYDEFLRETLLSIFISIGCTVAYCGAPKPKITTALPLNLIKLCAFLRGNILVIFNMH